MKIKRSEIDAAIAVEVMGWVRAMNGWWCKGEPRYRVIKVYSPSTDLNHAFEALETLCSKRTVGYSVLTLFHESVDKREVCITSDSDDSVISMIEHESLAIAICLALLSAVRGETVELED